MTFDPSTRCERTAAGDAELTLPALGLSLGQRRVLTLLQQPSAMAELAQKHHLESAKLERDLARLADLRLVQWLGEPTTAKEAQPPATAKPAPPAAAVSMTPVVIGRGSRRAPAMALVAASAALMVAAGLWYGTRPRNPEASPASATVAAMPSSASVATPGPAALAPARTAEEPASSLAISATTVLRGNGTPPERHPEVRPGLALLAAAGSASAPSPVSSAAPSPVSSPAPSPAPSPASSPAPAPPIAAVATPATRQAAASTPEIAPSNSPPVTPIAATVPPTIVPAVTAPTIADTSPPVQLAAANPSPAPRAAPPTPAPLKALSREPPDFPKEAIADGLKSGVVTARLHVDARGKVAGVDILSAQPPRVFDRAVRRALLQWQFEPPTAGAADVDVDVKFQRD